MRGGGGATTARDLREHTAARTNTRAGVPDDIETLLLGDLPSSVRTVRLERIGDVHVLSSLESHIRAVDRTDPGPDGTAVDDDGRTVVASSRNHTTGHVLVTASKQSA